MSAIESKYSNFKDRQAERKRVIVIFLILLPSLIGSGIILSYISDWGYWLDWISKALFMIGMLCFMVGFLYFPTRPWANEMIETRIFVNFYEASALLGNCSAEDENFNFHVKKAYAKAKEATLDLKAFSNFKNSSSRLLKNQVGKPLTKLVELLESRILPRITQKESVYEMKSVLSGLAQLFSGANHSLTLEDIISKNNDLERFDPFDTEDVTPSFRVILSKQPVRFLISYITSFGIITSGILVHSTIYQTDLGFLFGDLSIFIAYLGVCLTLGTAIFAVLRRRH